MRETHQYIREEVKLPLMRETHQYIDEEVKLPLMRETHQFVPLLHPDIHQDSLMTGSMQQVSEIINTIQTCEIYNFFMLTSAMHEISAAR